MHDSRNYNHDDGSREALLADLLDYAIIGAAHMERGITDYPRWSRAMRQERDPSIWPFLPGVFDNAKRIQQCVQKLHPH